MENQKVKGSSYAWAILIACIAFYAVPVGIIGNTAGIFVTPVMNEFGWTRTDATLYMSIQPLVAAILTPFAGRIITKYNPRWILVLTSLVYGLSSFACAYFTQAWQWDIYGVIYGACAAFFMYIAVPTMVNRWYRKNNGLAIGIAGAAISIIAAFMSPIGQAWITAYGWQTARIWMSLACTVISVVLTALLLRESPESMGVLPWGYSEEETDDGKNAQAAAQSEGATVAQARKSPALYLLMLVAGLFVMGASFFQQIPSFASTGALGAAAGAFAVTIVMIGGLVGKFVIGWFCDQFGSNIAGLIAGILGAVGIALSFISGGNVMIFYIGMALFGFGYSALSTVPPMLASQGFGTANFTAIYAMAATVLNLFAAAAPLIYAQIYDRTGSFGPAFILVIVLYVAVAVLSMAIIPTARKCWKK